MNMASTSAASIPNCREQEIQGLLKGTVNLKKFYVKYDPASSSECFCGQMVKMNGNTSNARRHIVKNHDDMVVFFLRSGKSIQDYSQTSESVNAGANKTHGSRGDEMEPSAAKIPRITHYFEPLDTPVTSPMVQGKQLTLEETIKSARKVSYDGRLQILREALLRFLCKTGTPLCCASDEAIDTFIKTVYPGSKLLGSIAATDMLKDVMSSVAKTKRDDFYNALGDNPFSLDLQIVNIFEDKSLLGLFIYFLDKDNHCIRSSCYHSAIINDSATDVAVYGQIKQVFEEEDLELKNVIAVFDPQSELASSALQLLVDFKKILKISCFYEVIGDLKRMVVSSPICQLTLKLAVEVRSFINNDSEIFEEFQQHGNITSTNISRWLSPCTVDDLENLDVFYSYSKLIAHSLSCVTDQIDVPEVSNVTFKKTKELISLLQVIKDVEASEKQSPPIYSQYLPHLQILNNNLKSMPLKDATINNLKDNLTAHLDKKIETKKLSKYFTACHILDPRYRKCLLDDNALVMLHVTQDAKANLKKYLEKHNQSLTNPSANPNVSSRDSRASDASNSSEEDDPEEMPEDRTRTFSNKRALVSMEISSFLSKKGGRRQPNLSCIEVAESNFDSYLKMSIVPENTNVFEFWNSRLAAQPVLAKMALDKLSVPGVRNRNLKTGIAHSKALLECGEQLNDFVFLSSLGDNYW